MSARKMPAQRPGQSEQDVQTPPEFLQPVQQRFGAIKFDLAANRSNAVVPRFFGPGSSLAEDALAPESNWQRPGLQWLNMPFGQVAAFMARCQRECKAFGIPLGGGAEILALSPAAVSTDWFANYVYGHALVISVRPRIKFVGHEQGFPKDLMLTHWGPRVTPGFELWNWATGMRTRLKADVLVNTWCDQ